jgi:hypothetical protein
MMTKVVMSLGMGAREGDARQGEKSGCLEEHVGWMMRSVCYKRCLVFERGILGSEADFW